MDDKSLYISSDLGLNNTSNFRVYLLIIYCHITILNTVNSRVVLIPVSENGIGIGKYMVSTWYRHRANTM